MIRDDQTPEGSDAPPLSPLSWLVLPILLVGALGLAVPVVAVELRSRSPSEPLGVSASYSGELLPLLERDDLAPEALLSIRDFHERMAKSQSSRGGISAEDSQKVQKLLRAHSARPR